MQTVAGPTPDFDDDRVRVRVQSVRSEGDVDAHEAAGRDRVVRRFVRERRLRVADDSLPRNVGRRLDPDIAKELLRVLVEDEELSRV